MIMIRSARLDAAESAFFARELEHIHQRTYDIRYPNLMAREVIPVNNEAGPGATSTTYRQFDEVGEAKFISNNAKDLPRVDILGDEFTRPVRHVGDAYGWNIFELRAAAKANRSLDQRRAAAARRAVEVLLDRVACFGSPAHGIVDGLLNNADIPSQAVAAAWAGATPDQILADVGDAIERIVDVTNGIEMPNAIGFDPVTYTHISVTRLGGNSDTTILKYILANFPMIKRAFSWYRLKTAGAGSTRRMMVGRFEADVLYQEITSEFEQLPPQEDGLEFIVNCIASTAGTTVISPKAIDFSDGL